jgi:hypothetical protein
MKIIMNVFLYFQEVIYLLQFPTPKFAFSYTIDVPEKPK